MSLQFACRMKQHGWCVGGGIDWEEWQENWGKSKTKWLEEEGIKLR